MTRYGVQLPSFSGIDPADLFEHVASLVTAAEEAGFDSVWVMDHFYQLPPLGGPDQPMLEAYTLLAALAARTRRVQLGTLVTGVTYRSPAILAKIITTLDVISRGRAVLGIGAAWYDVEHQGLGIDYPADRVRLDMLEEAVQVCRAMFTGDDVSFSGRHYRLDHARNLPRPVQAGVRRSQPRSSSRLSLARTFSLWRPVTSRPARWAAITQVTGPPAAATASSSDR